MSCRMTSFLSLISLWKFSNEFCNKIEKKMVQDALVIFNV